MATAFFIAAISSQGFAADTNTENTDALVGPWAWHANNGNRMISRLFSPAIHTICATSVPSGEVVKVSFKLSSDKWKETELHGGACISIEATRVKVKASKSGPVSGNYSLVR